MSFLETGINLMRHLHVSLQMKAWEVSDKVKALRSEDNKIVDEVVESYNKPKEG